MKAVQLGIPPLIMHILAVFRVRKVLDSVSYSALVNLVGNYRHFSIIFRIKQEFKVEQNNYKVK